MPTLTELDVVLVMKGAEMVQKGLAGVKDQSAAADKGLDKVKDATAGAGKGMESLTKITGAADRAFNSITGTLMGFVRAGLQGTVQGAVLEYRFQMLSREIATVFLPVINEVIDYLQKGINWFRSLSQEQVDSYRKWVLVGLGVLGVVAAIPKAIAAFGLLKAAMTAVFAAGPIGAFVLLATAIAGIGIAAAESSKEVEKLREEAERFKQKGLTKEEYNKDPTSRGVYDEKKGREENLKAIQKEIDAIERMQAADKARLDSKKGKTIEQAENVIQSGRDLLGLGKGATAKQMERNEEVRKQMAEDLARLRMQEEAVASGEGIKFHEPKKKVRDELALMPQHGFQSFTDKWRTGQLAALKAEDPNKQTAENTKEMKEKIAAIALKLATMPFPIIR